VATRAAGRLLALERDGHVRLARAPGRPRRRPLGRRARAVMHPRGAPRRSIPGWRRSRLWHAAGLRSLGPVWSRPNAFAHGVPFAFPSSPDTGPGLTDAGTAAGDAAVASWAIAVDLSNLNEAGFGMSPALDGAPLIASHSACHALAPASRNLTDRQLDAIAASGGLVGVVYAVNFLRADGTRRPTRRSPGSPSTCAKLADRVGVALRRNVWSELRRRDRPPPSWSDAGRAAAPARRAARDRLQRGRAARDRVARTWVRVLERAWGHSCREPRVRWIAARS